MFYVTFLLYPLNFHESPKYEQSGTVGRKVQIYIFIYEWFIFIKISLIKIGEINPMQILTLLLLVFFFIKKTYNWKEKFLYETISYNTYSIERE